MAKVNLITIHWGCSYGGTMQTFATINLLKQLGHDVTLINLVHPKHNLSKNRPSGVSWVFIEIWFALFRFCHFGNMTKKMYELKMEYIPQCDYSIVGSDQVWNEDITKPINIPYFLSFAGESKKLSFSSSFGKYKWENDKETTDLVQSYLSLFNAISVREESGVKICKDIFGLEAIQVLDPTLVYDNYDTLLCKVKRKAILYPFLLINSEEACKICKIVSDETGLPIYRASKIRYALSCGPLSWLRRIKSSEFIITDSFHGLAFSILFHKRFLVVCANEKKFTRLQSLLSLFGLDDRYIRSAEDLRCRLDIIKENIDYEAVDKVLIKERRKSIDFLRKNIDN